MAEQRRLMIDETETEQRRLMIDEFRFLDSSSIEAIRGKLFFRYIISIKIDYERYSRSEKNWYFILSDEQNEVVRKKMRESYA
ncbi:hypothetical protein Ddye_002429 [Dipteronia dyeriana]|uniref:Uncharacterized protein n=1 Tax=Dipteronia dyeriana TaxID=168575 RepID=A0AAD9XQQ6_9ROSI|nr:hypothetical protein Ddye_002429 [Dipteronia dyeriana]